MSLPEKKDETGQVLYRLNKLEESMRERDLDLRADLKSAIDNFTRTMERFSEKYEVQQKELSVRNEALTKIVNEQNLRLVQAEQNIGLGKWVLATIATALLSFTLVFVGNYIHDYTMPGKAAIHASP